MREGKGRKVKRPDRSEEAMDPQTVDAVSWQWQTVDAVSWRLVLPVLSAGCAERGAVIVRPSWGSSIWTAAVHQ